MITLDSLAERARTLVNGGQRAILGITGSPGAGKTTLAEHLVHLLRENPPASLSTVDWVAHVPMDGFHLADIQLRRLEVLDRKGAPDTFDVAGYRALLQRIHDDADDVIYAPTFERELEQPVAGSIAIPRAARLIVTEGNYLLLDQGNWAGIRHQLDEVWYCELGTEKRKNRLVARHERFGKNHGTAVTWVENIDEPNAELIAPTRHYANVVIPEAFLETIGKPE